MPEVIMLVGMASSDRSWDPGDKVEVNADVAKAWIENGIAKSVPVKQTKKKQTKGSDE